MKKLLFTAAIAVLGFTSVNAQEFKLGAKAGLNIASVTGDDLSEFDSRTSFHFGAVAQIGISEKFAVQPELIYSAQGASASEEGSDLIAKLDYLLLPILADFSVTEGLSLQAGPQIGFNIADSLEFDGEDFGDIDAESVDFGLALGAQYQLDSGLFLQARYALGLSDINSEGDAKNSNISLSVGYFFL